jgi:hypothetical protein
MCRVGNFRQKTELTEQMDISEGVPAVPRNIKLSEFRSEPFREIGNNSKFCSGEQKYKQTLGMPFRTIPRKRKQFRT